MTHDELLLETKRRLVIALYSGDVQVMHALNAVIELHYEHTSGSGDVYCYNCQQKYPCLTIQAIEKELK